MDTRNMLIEEDELQELTDAELEGVCGGSSRFYFSPFTNNSNNSNFSNSNFSNSNFSTAPVTQTAYANSSIGNVSLPLLSSVGSNSVVNFGGSAQATNYYNYSVGYFPR